MNKKNYILIVIFLFLSSKGVYAQKKVKSPPSIQNALVYFLDPECKLCISKALDIKNMILKYSQDTDLNIYLIFHSNTDFKKSKKYFKNVTARSKSAIFKFDSENLFAIKLNATITPSAYLVDQNEQIIYQGALDDKDISVEITKFDKSTNYVDRAIEDYLQNIDIRIPTTKAIGCIFR
jgi:hypothetical protein